MCLSRGILQRILRAVREDPRQNLLRYLILEAKQAPLEQLIVSLERYCQDELDEKWLYKLAELYQKAGREEDCVRICDKLMLLFGSEST